MPEESKIPTPNDFKFSFRELLGRSTENIKTNWRKAEVVKRITSAFSGEHFVPEDVLVAESIVDANEEKLRNRFKALSDEELTDLGDNSLRLGLSLETDHNLVFGNQRFIAALSQNLNALLYQSNRVVSKSHEIRYYFRSRPDGKVYFDLYLEKRNRETPSE